MKRVLVMGVAMVMMVALQLVAVNAQSKGKSMSVTGTVKSVSGDSLAVTANGKDMNFTIDAATRFVGKGLSTKSASGPLKATDAVAANDRVRVTYTQSGGAMHASTVTITNKAAVKK